MTLRVLYKGFPDAVRRTLGITECYLLPVGGALILTAGHAEKATVIVCNVMGRQETITKELHSAGMHVYEGIWSVDDDQEILQLPFVAAVAYKSIGDKPGVWIDAFPHVPTEVQVLEAMYEDLKSTGELESVTVEEFLKHTVANVGIVSPEELREYIIAKSPLL